MSHVKNVEAFEKLLGICTGYGGQYNPGQQNLHMENLTSLLTNARNALLEVNAARTSFENATNNREVAFGDIARLATRIVSELKASGALNQTVDDARAMVRKLSGSKAPGREPVPAEQAEQAKVRTRTARGQDYGSMAQHFEKLLQTISAEQRYQPNVQELQVERLTDKLATLRNENTGVVQAVAELGNARMNRNAVLYGDDNGLYSTALAVKQHVKAAFGYRSEAHRQVSGIRFTKPKT